MKELKSLEAFSLTSMGPALKNTFDLLNTNRGQTGIDTYGQVVGRLNRVCGVREWKEVEGGEEKKEKKEEEEEEEEEEEKEKEEKKKEG